jgi:hypothetical protein
MIARKSVQALVAVAATMAGVAVLCAGESQPQLRGHFTKFGIYMPAGSGKRITERGSATGYVTEGGRIFQSAGTNVDLVKGVSFGFDFRIDGVPAVQPLRLTHLIAHPKMKKPDGATLEKQTFDRDVMGTDGTISGTLWYTLREDFELLPGEWTLSVLHGTKVLVEKRFSVAQTPSAAPTGK